MKFLNLVTAPAVIACFVPVAHAQQHEEEYPTGIYAGIVAEQVELAVSQSGFDAGKTGDDPTYGVRLGGRFNTGTPIIVSLEGGVDFSQGRSTRLQKICDKQDGCDALYMQRTEDGVRWSASGTVAVGYHTGPWLLSVFGGVQVAEVVDRQENYRNHLLEYVWEGTNNAVGPIYGVRGEYSFGALSIRGELAHRELDYDGWEYTNPGFSTQSGMSTVAGNSIQFGIFTKL